MLTTHKRSYSPSLFNAAKPESLPGSSHRHKKRKLIETYASESPFPNFHHPTSSEAHSVFNLLSNAYPQYATTLVAPKSNSNSAASCGSSQNIIDALIGVILSQNTSGKNASSAKASLDAAFGRDNFAAIAASPRDDVIAAIRHGGLANKKSATIQNLLISIEKRHGKYSLQHLADTNLSDEEIMKELTSYEGVGLKRRRVY